MQFDIFTLMTTSSVVVAVLGLTVLLFWSRDRKAGWLAWWGAAFVLLALGNMLVLGRLVLNDAISYGFGTSCVIAGFGMVWLAARNFERRKPLFWPLVLSIVIWIGLYFFGDISDNRVLCVMLPSVPMAGGLWLAAFEFYRGRDEKLPSKQGAIYVLIFLGSVFAARLPLAPFAPFPMGQFPTNGYWAAAFNGTTIISAILMAAFLISMTLERLERGQRELARSDPLTGLANRRALDEVFDQGIAAQTAVMVFDLDRFKLVNDYYGHATGDALIKRFTQICRENIRQVDFAARLGGEEFLVVVPGADPDTAWNVAERIREGFANEIVATPVGEVACTVSVGIEISLVDGETLGELIQRADVELYRAKRNGRNRACIASEHRSAA